ncbi:putative chaP protein [Mycobacterium xenopi 4042]|uniref:Putative chaP protein n=1 Tax=Mycobacterium xenopi 4042 TaxID=1299334 RepID=X8DXU3_MYCXE|nr:putative chaP protein [Mycobacterium xenopi 3993]EUA73477.1 putative chaP protein [Mycobacterium xenopi 4042]
MSEDDFDAIYGKICARGMQHWADPRGNDPGRSTATMAAAASTSATRMATTWRSSLAPTARAADQLALRGPCRFFS